MDAIPAVAAYATAASQEKVSTEVGIRVMKMANDQQKLAGQLLVQLLQAATAGVGRNIDVTA